MRQTDALCEQKAVVANHMEIQEGLKLHFLRGTLAYIRDRRSMDDPDIEEHARLHVYNVVGASLALKAITGYRRDTMV